MFHGGQVYAARRHGSRTRCDQGVPMRKLLNTLYITDENAYLSLEGETIVCKSEAREPLKIPFANLENIVCFSYLGCSPALMGKCSEAGVGLSFFTPHGRFLARVSGSVQGNVYTRVQQLAVFQTRSTELIQNAIAAKLVNTRFLLERILRDYPDFPSRDRVSAVSEMLRSQAKEVLCQTDTEILRGIEGNCAKQYFAIFGSLIRNSNEIFRTFDRSKHPPLDAVNAVLSFLYAMLTNDIASALESVGLDSYIGFFHTLRSGRPSLACDLVEELRHIAERMTLTLINLRQLDEKDFSVQISGAVYLNDDGRKKVLKAWQERKREVFTHPYLKQKIAYGLLPFVQSNLLAKFVRGEIGEYPPFLAR